MNERDLSLENYELQENGSYRKKKQTTVQVTAKGQLKPRKMNSTEKAYSDHLEAQKHLGIILWWEFEAITFRLGDDCYFKPDFVVMMVDGLIEIRDTKGTRKNYTKKHGEHYVGRVEDDAQVKLRACAERYPFKFFTAYKLPEKHGGTWVLKEY